MKLFDIALKDMLRSFRSMFAVGMMSRRAAADHRDDLSRVLAAQQRTT
jgi:hypothetical protein